MVFKIKENADINHKCNIKYKKNEVLAFRDYFTLHGDINNPTLRIYCKNGKKTKFGVNLNEKRQKELIDAIMKLKQFYTNNSDI